MHHEAVYVVAFGAHDGGERHHSKAGVAVHAYEHAHEWHVVVDLRERQQRAQGEHAQRPGDELLADHEVAHGGTQLKFDVLACDAKLVEEEHVACLKLLYDFCLGDLNVDGCFLQMVVDRIQGYCQQQDCQPTRGAPCAEAAHEIGGAKQSPGVVLIKEIAEIEHYGIECHGRDDKEDVAVYEGAPQKIPIAVEHEHGPPPQKESGHTPRPIVLGKAHEAEGHKVEAPEEIVGLKAHAQEKGVEEKA